MSNENSELSNSILNLNECGSFIFKFIDFFNFDSESLDNSIKKIEYLKSCDSQSRRLWFLWDKHSNIENNNSKLLIEECACVGQAEFFSNQSRPQFYESYSEYEHKPCVLTLNKMNERTGKLLYGFGQSIIEINQPILFSNRSFFYEIYDQGVFFQDIRQNLRIAPKNKFIVVSNIEQMEQNTIKIRKKFEPMEICVYDELELNRFLNESVDVNLFKDLSEESIYLNSSNMSPPYFASDFSIYVRYLPLIKKETNYVYKPQMKSENNYFSCFFEIPNLIENPLNSEPHSDLKTQYIKKYSLTPRKKRNYNLNLANQNNLYQTSSFLSINNNSNAIRAVVSKVLNMSSSPSPPSLKQPKSDQKRRKLSVKDGISVSKKKLSLISGKKKIILHDPSSKQRKLSIEKTSVPRQSEEQANLEISKESSFSANYIFNINQIEAGFKLSKIDEVDQANKLCIEEVFIQNIFCLRHNSQNSNHDDRNFKINSTKNKINNKNKKSSKEEIRINSRTKCANIFRTYLNLSPNSLKSLSSAIELFATELLSYNTIINKLNQLKFHFNEFCICNRFNKSLESFQIIKFYDLGLFLSNESSICNQNANLNNFISKTKSELVIDRLEIKNKTLLGDHNSEIFDFVNQVENFMIVLSKLLFLNQIYNLYEMKFQLTNRITKNNKIIALNIDFDFKSSFKLGQNNDYLDLDVSFDLHSLSMELDRNDSFLLYNYLLTLLDRTEIKSLKNYKSKIFIDKLNFKVNTEPGLLLFRYNCDKFRFFSSNKIKESIFKIELSSLLEIFSASQNNKPYSIKIDLDKKILDAKLNLELRNQNLADKSFQITCILPMLTDSIFNFTKPSKMTRINLPGVLFYATIGNEQNRRISLLLEMINLEAGLNLEEKSIILKSEKIKHVNSYESISRHPLFAIDHKYFPVKKLEILTSQLDYAYFPNEFTEMKWFFLRLYDLKFVANLENSDSDKFDLRFDNTKTKLKNTKVDDKMLKKSTKKIKNIKTNNKDELLMNENDVLRIEKNIFLNVNNHSERNESSLYHDYHHQDKQQFDFYKLLNFVCLESTESFVYKIGLLSVLPDLFEVKFKRGINDVWSFEFKGPSDQFLVDLEAFRDFYYEMSKLLARDNERKELVTHNFDEFYKIVDKKSKNVAEKIFPNNVSSDFIFFSIFRDTLFGNISTVFQFKE
jgi:hypothetical protein